MDPCREVGVECAHPGRDLPPDPFDRLLALLEVVLVAVAGSVLALILLAMMGTTREQLTGDIVWLVAFMGLETVLTLALVALLLRLRGQPVSLLGLAPPVVRNLAVGVCCLPLLFGVTLAASFFFRVFAPGWVTDSNPLLDLIQTSTDVTLLLLASVMTGGFKEEVQRAFALQRFESHLGGLTVGLVLWTLFFGLGHTFQGLDSAVGAGLLGLVFGLLYIWRRNLWAPIAAHATFNVTTILIYWL